MRSIRDVFRATTGLMLVTLVLMVLFAEVRGGHLVAMAAIIAAAVVFAAIAHVAMQVHAGAKKVATACGAGERTWLVTRYVSTAAAFLAWAAAVVVFAPAASAWVMSLYAWAEQAAPAPFLLFWFCYWMMEVLVSMVAAGVIGVAVIPLLFLGRKLWLGRRTFRPMEEISGAIFTASYALMIGFGLVWAIAVGAPLDRPASSGFDGGGTVRFPWESRPQPTRGTNYYRGSPRGDGSRARWTRPWSADRPNDTHVPVRGHFRNGSYVRPHMRRRPDAPRGR